MHVERCRGLAAAVVRLAPHAGGRAADPPLLITAVYRITIGTRVKSAPVPVAGRWRVNAIIHLFIPYSWPTQTKQTARFTYVVS